MKTLIFFICLFISLFAQSQTTLTKDSLQKSFILASIEAQNKFQEEITYRLQANRNTVVASRTNLIIGTTLTVVGSLLMVSNPKQSFSNEPFGILSIITGSGLVFNVIGTYQSLRSIRYFDMSRPISVHNDQIETKTSNIN